MTLNKTTLTPFIVGAGGVASYLLPVLLRQFKLQHGVLVDADILEERNLDRQVFAPDLVGKNKAEALLDANNVSLMEDLISYGAARIIPYEGWYDAETIANVVAENPFIKTKDFNVIISLVDNNPTRIELLDLADEWQVPLLVCVNEVFDSQAYIYLPKEHKETQMDPRVRYPEMFKDSSDDPRNPSCQTTQEAFPQLASANMMSAALGIQLLNLWFGEDTRPKPAPEFRTIDIMLGRGCRNRILTQYSIKNQNKDLQTA